MNIYILNHNIIVDEVNYHDKYTDAVAFKCFDIAENYLLDNGYEYKIIEDEYYKEEDGIEDYVKIGSVYLK